MKRGPGDGKQRDSVRREMCNFPLCLCFYECFKKYFNCWNGQALFGCVNKGSGQIYWQEFLYCVLKDENVQFQIQTMFNNTYYY